MYMRAHFISALPRGKIGKLDWTLLKNIFKILFYDSKKNNLNSNIHIFTHQFRTSGSTSNIRLAERTIIIYKSQCNHFVDHSDVFGGRTWNGENIPFSPFCRGVGKFPGRKQYLRLDPPIPNRHPQDEHFCVKYAAALPHNKLLLLLKTYICNSSMKNIIKAFTYICINSFQGEHFFLQEIYLRNNLAKERKNNNKKFAGWRSAHLSKNNTSEWTNEKTTTEKLLKWREIERGREGWRTHVHTKHLFETCWLFRPESSEILQRFGWRHQCHFPVHCTKFGNNKKIGRKSRNIAELSAISYQRWKNYKMLKKGDFLYGKIPYEITHLIKSKLTIKWHKNKTSKSRIVTWEAKM